MSKIIIILNNFRIMEKIDVEAFKKEWFSFEEIEWIKEWLEDIKNGRVISHSEIKEFVSNELFSKYKINI
jgi:predicted transcriptional regulator